MDTIPIEKFNADYRVKYARGGTEWVPCVVVGISVPDIHSTGQFVIMIEDEDGSTYAGCADTIRRTD